MVPDGSLTVSTQPWYLFIMSLSFFFFIHQLQKQNYRQEKKRAAKELFSALKDPSVVIMSNWLKVRHKPEIFMMQ